MYIPLNTQIISLLPCERGKALLGRELTPEEKCTFVTGFTDQDFNIFVGNVRHSLYLFFRRD